MARPQPYEPSTSFADYSASNPSRPIRGQDLDVEFNDIQLSVAETQSWLAGITGDDGGLKFNIITKYHLTDDFAASLAGDIYEIVGPTATQAANAASAAQVYANNAEASKIAAEAAAQATAGESDIAITARDQTQTYRNQTVGYMNAASESATTAANWSNSALGHANFAALSRDESRQWAEFIGGPVVEDSLDPDAYDDGLWSAKWWALKAAQWAQAVEVGGSGVVGEAGPEGFGMVVYSLVELDNLLGPLDDDVALVTDPPSIWHFDVDSAAGVDGDNVRAPADGTAGRWLRLAFATGSGTGTEYYEGDTEPVDAGTGAIWVDTSGDSV